MKNLKKGVILFLYLKFATRNVFLTATTFKGKVLLGSGYRRYTLGQVRERLTYSGVKNFAFQFSKELKNNLKSYFLLFIIKNKFVQKKISFLVNRFSYGLFITGFGHRRKNNVIFRKAAFRGLMAQNIKVIFLKNLNPIAFNGCFLSKKTGRKRRKLRINYNFYFLKKKYRALGLKTDKLIF